MKTALRVFLYVLAGYLLLALISPLLHSLHVRLYAPDPALAIVVFAAVSLDLLPGLVVAWLLGFIRDGFSGGSPVGLHMEIYVAVLLAGTLLAKRLDYRNLVFMTLVTAAASLLSSALMAVFLAIFDQDFDHFALVLRLAGPQALITAPMGPAAAGLLRLIDRRLLSVDRDGLFR